MRINMKLLVLLSILPVIVFGQAKVGTAIGQFLEIPVSARAEGMASAFLATADDISAIYYNPGGLAWQNGRQLTISHTMLYAGISHDFGAYTMPAAGGVVGVSFISLYTGDIDETTPYQPEGTGRTYTAGDLAVGLCYSRILTDRFSVGVNVKYLGEYLADVHAQGWAMDIGTIFKTAFKDIRLGMALTNFGPDLKFIQQSAPLPMSFHFGAAGEIINNPTNRITLDIEGSHPNDNLEKFQVGAEYAYKEMVFIRAGGKLQYDTDLFTLGTGCKIPIGSFMMRADYSFTYMRYLSSVHRFSLGAEF
ncbi:hypothetical protein DRQ29_02685 [bacterium]|nr:MAG: hypothetical protein DRQ29_02685 [bacterium]